MATHRYWRLYITGNRSGLISSIAYTEWRGTVGGANLITGGTPSADSTYSGSYQASYGFDSDLTQLWSSSNSAFPHWLKYDFGAGSPVDINEVMIQNRSTGALDEMPTTSVLQWSDDDSAWTDHILIDHTAVNTNSGTGAYAYVPLVITGAWELPGLTVSSTGAGESSGIELPPMTVAALLGGVGNLELPLPTTTGELGGAGDLILPSIEAVGMVPIYGDFSLPALTATGSATVDVAGTASITLAALTGAGESGAVGALSLPGLTATGSLPEVNAPGANISLPAITASGELSGGFYGSADINLPDLDVDGVGGGLADITISGGYSLESSSTLELFGSADLTLPAVTATGEGSLVLTASGALVLPALRMDHVVAVMVLPAITVTGVASLSGSVEYEAYVVNLKSTDGNNRYEVTRYTNWPFTRVIRLGESYYGVSTDGLYLLGGDTDDTEPIAWNWLTAKTDFDDIKLKTVAEVTVGGRFGSSAVAKVIECENDHEYVYHNPREADSQNTRIKFGRGLKSRYYQFGMNDDEGSDLSIDTLDFAVVPHRRVINGNR